MVDLATRPAPPPPPPPPPIAGPSILPAPPARRRSAGVALGIALAVLLAIALVGGLLLSLGVALMRSSDGEVVAEPAMPAPMPDDLPADEHAEAVLATAGWCRLPAGDATVQLLALPGEVGDGCSFVDPRSAELARIMLLVNVQVDEQALDDLVLEASRVSERSEVDLAGVRAARTLEDGIAGRVVAWRLEVGPTTTVMLTADAEDPFAVAVLDRLAERAVVEYPAA